ncbi:RNA polymerase sigma-70 factor [Mucilaginibacter jinjuensis]|uniref:RNA polymerase sigma-70 factor n=1 Tax=Mucilaginibacter jinjuensis TaxID=1176721 RepID=A0ABY7T3U1_9SPHI|nr:RNA polymerase sigma-70 factor [Mucilaginibacter jinjuensis]WCT11041.1 RNA polymerase sigma-70 factor [Mucilaginibacter jinjuensis]
MNEKQLTAGLFGEVEFETLFKAHFKELHAYAFSFLKDWDKAEEVVQGLFLKLWEKRELPEMHTSIRSYLYKAAYHDCLNLIRREKVHQQYQSRTAFAMKDESDNAANTIYLRDVQSKLSAALNKLPEKCRTVFHLSRFEELKYRQIADELGISIKTVETQMGKALKILRGEMREFLPLIAVLLLKIFRS